MPFRQENIRCKIGGASNGGLCHVIHCIRNDPAYENANTLLALRSTCKNLRIASDAARACIVLNTSQLCNGFPYFSTFTSLTNITIRASSSNLRRIQCNLSLVSSAVPNLVVRKVLLSLSGCIVIPDINQALLPWRHSLQDLELEGCNMITKSSDTGIICHQLAWMPNLPLLKSLVLPRALLKNLDLSDCVNLQNLNISLKWNLSELSTPRVKSLTNVLCELNDALVSLDLSGFDKLCSLTCMRNACLVDMNAHVCPALTWLYFI